MSRKLSVTFTMFTSTPTRMGVLVSLAARSAVPKMMVAARGSMGRYRMKKYCDAMS